MASTYDTSRYSWMNRQRQGQQEQRQPQQQGQQQYDLQQQARQQAREWTAPQQPQAAQVRTPLSGQLSNLYADMTNRLQANYGLNTDSLYRAYRDMYALNGQRAALDTLGYAQQQTGGYGNSYGLTAANQQYQDYMARLNEAIPQLYQMEQGQRNADREFNYARDIDQRNFDYQRQMADREFDYAQRQDQQKLAYSIAMTLLQGGQMPDPATLAAAGISEADAAALHGMYAPQPVQAGGGGGGAKKQDAGGDDIFTRMVNSVNSGVNTAAGRTATTAQQQAAAAANGYTDQLLRNIVAQAGTGNPQLKLRSTLTKK